jgi:acetyltransferase-like isoleucine patch superfamily enzyme
MRRLFRKFKNLFLAPVDVATGAQGDFLFSNEMINDPNVEIGDFTYGLPNILHWGEGAKLVIGKYCSIAEGVTIFLGGNHRVDWITTYPFNSIEHFKDQGQFIKGHPATKGDIIIGNDVWIGRGAVIMSGVTIGSGAVIAAGSVVSKNVQPYAIVGGNPAKHIRFRFSEEEIDTLLELKWWDLDEDAVRQIIPVLSSNNFEQLQMAVPRKNELVKDR